jgi:hypothetical protein
MRQNNLAPVGWNQQLVLYNIKRIYDSAVDIDMGSILIYGRFNMERSGA